VIARGLKQMDLGQALSRYSLGLAAPTFIHKRDPTSCCRAASALVQAVVAVFVDGGIEDPEDLANAQGMSAQYTAREVHGPPETMKRSGTSLC
jgi:hypothetical protein